MDDFEPVRRFHARSPARQAALVLIAVGIECRLLVDPAGYLLCVAPADAARARDELLLFEQENRPVPVPTVPDAVGGRAVEAALGYAAVLLFFFAAVHRRTFPVDWLELGAADAGLMAQGEWWRAVTALCLHAESGHLLGNLAYGAAVGLLLAHRIGTGLAWCTIVLAGSLGNALNGLLQGAEHVAIGASTGLFGAVGVLSVYADRTRPVLWRIGLRRWQAAAAGVMLLAFFGLEGERTDVGAHVAGFAVGGLIGFLLGAGGGRPWLHARVVQLAAGAFAVALPALAWLVALTR